MGNEKERPERHRKALEGMDWTVDCMDINDFELVLERKGKKNTGGYLCCMNL